MKSGYNSDDWEDEDDDLLQEMADEAAKKSKKDDKNEDVTSYDDPDYYQSTSKDHVHVLVDSEETELGGWSNYKPRTRKRPTHSSSRERRRTYMKYGVFVGLVLILIINTVDYIDDDYNGVWSIFLRKKGTARNDVSSTANFDSYKNQFESPSSTSSSQIDDNDDEGEEEGDDGVLFTKHENILNSNYRSVERIVILGERNIHTEAIVNHLQGCFPHISITTSLSRSGEWFQDENKLYELGHEMHETTMILAIFLNVYDWVCLMHQNPINAPFHKDMDWKTFVTTPWTVPDSELHSLTPYPMNSAKSCQEGFGIEEVIPCQITNTEYTRKTDKTPIYELHHDKSGNAYQSILELRAEKIRNIMALKHIPKLFLNLKYENLARQNGMESDLVQYIMAETNIPSQCDLENVILPQALEDSIHDESFVNYLNEHVDWNAEGMISYRFGERINSKTHEVDKMHSMAKVDATQVDIPIVNSENFHKLEDDDEGDELDEPPEEQQIFSDTEIDSLIKSSSVEQEKELTDEFQKEERQQENDALKFLNENTESYAQQQQYNTPLPPQEEKLIIQEPPPEEKPVIPEEEPIIMEPSSVEESSESNEINMVSKALPSLLNPQEQNSILEEQEQLTDVEISQEITNEINQDVDTLDQPYLEPTHTEELTPQQKEEIPIIDSGNLGEPSSNKDTFTEVIDSEALGNPPVPAPPGSIEAEFKDPDISTIIDLLNDDDYLDIEKEKEEEAFESKRVNAPVEAQQTNNDGVNFVQGSLGDENNEEISKEFEELFDKDGITEEVSQGNNISPTENEASLTTEQNILEKEESAMNEILAENVSPMEEDKSPEMNSENNPSSAEVENLSLENKPVRTTVENVILLAERNSGLEWLLPRIEQCFPSLQISTTLSRPAPWFQDENHLPADLPPSLVFTLFINPYTWVKLMQLNPQHAPSHKKLPWREFTSKSWTLDQRPSDDLTEADLQANPKARCQFQFEYNQVIPCKETSTLYDYDYPVYEMHPFNNMVYNSILELRRDKVANLLSIQDWKKTQDKIVEVLSLKYDDLMNKEFGYAVFMKDILTPIEELSGTKASCDDVYGNSNFIAPSPPNTRSEDEMQFMEWIKDHLAWDVEHLIGFDKEF